MIIRLWTLSLIPKAKIKKKLKINKVVVATSKHENFYDFFDNHFFYLFFYFILQLKNGKSHFLK